MRSELTVWEPLGLADEVDRVFWDSFLPSFHGKHRVQNFSPKADLKETEKEFLFSFDLPGFSKDSLSIEVEENVLSVSGERKSEKLSEDVSHHFTERWSGSFQRQFRLPKNVQSDAIEANYESGVLEVRIPKSEAAQPKKIAIQEGKTLLSRFKKKD